MARSIVFAVFGLIWGSFLNVVIYRVPRKISIVRPPSACASCGTPIRPFDNVPLLSYALLRGRCRDCSARISPRYPLVELAVGTLWVAASLRFVSTEEAVFVSLATSILFALAVIDLDCRRLPNVIVLPATAVALAWVGVAALATSRPEIALEALACGVAAFTLLLVIALIAPGGMGFGDVKLVGLIGVVTGRFGWRVSVAAIFMGFIAGGLVAVVLLVTRRKGRRESIPFGPALALGAIVAFYAGAEIVDLWLGV